MFRRKGSAVATSRAEDWPGLGMWFASSETCPECQPYLLEQQRTMAEARARRAAPPPSPREDPPGLGEWFASSEECPECQPYLEEQRKTRQNAKHRPTAPARAIQKARERARAQATYLMPDVETPDLGRFEWDLPEDHEMSTGGKIAWNVAIYGTIAAIPAVLFLTSPFSVPDTAKHYLAAAGCPYAKMLNVANARVGLPGYHSHLDTDDDGIACEPQSTRQLSTGGRHFIRAPGE